VPSALVTVKDGVSDAGRPLVEITRLPVVTGGMFGAVESLPPPQAATSEAETSNPSEQRTDAPDDLNMTEHPRD